MFSILPLCYSKFINQSMKKILLSSSVLLFAALSFAQQRSTLPVTSGSSSPTNGLSNVSAAKQGPKPYKEVITEKAITQKGLFNVHQIDQKYYFEIADSIFDREILSVVRFAKVPAGAGYGGEIANQQTIRFEKGTNQTIFLRTITLVNTADANQ